MANGGFIKIYRKMLDWEWYDDINTKTLFLHLLLTANYEPRRWRGIEIEAGSRIVSREGLANETGLTVTQIRRALSNLESTREITRKTTNKYTLVTLVKWRDYQGGTTGKQPTNNPQHDQQTATVKEVKKLRTKDIKDKDLKDSCAEPENPALAPQPTEVTLPPVIILPLNDGSDYAVSQEQVGRWAELYPAVDIHQELRNMRGWLDANRAKRKTRNGVLRFINGWLAREQDKGGTKARAAPVSFAEERRQQEQVQDNAFEQLKRMMRGGISDG